MSFLLGRLGQTVLVLLVASFVAFALFRYVGDPVNNMVGQAASMADREAVRRALGLDDPMVVQFARFIGNALRGDFGISYRFGQPVAALIGERFPATLELSLISMVIATGLGVPLGVWTALHRGSVLSQVLLAVSLVGVALPTFLIGIALILIFSVGLGWLPSFGRGEVVALGGWTTGLLTVSGLKALVLPSVTLGVFQLALIMRLARAEMLEVMRTDFIRFAKARGLKPRAIEYRHALRNTLLPVITIVGLQFGNVFAFSIIVETVFQWPGLGLLVIQAIQFADVPLLAGYLVLIALCFAVINLAVDLAYVAIDPRVRGSRAAGRAT
ncbi:ABC transporter permease [Xanthobacter tagetidis]|jgi:peptide/nickel transport system permease protein|uniref:ABC transporter permease n=1 Tax=Xanthobacter tagetidis TaxID=60216 RepID=A0A3L7ADF2_9HYPH|nr:ABC transporter permease [Xanthobacter tagetidis]MBB6305908.1 peptide/nickel transport system permease protein [Xanthobacter tagetidis]RLP78429.1 ABC transporter permease [Xanthobacter tagetidis]